MEKPYELPKGLWAWIAKKANQLWEQRGCREGHDLEDWFDAEAIVMEARREASHMSRIEQIQIVQLDKVSQAGDTDERVPKGDNPVRSSTKAMLVVVGGVAVADWSKRWASGF